MKLVGDGFEMELCRECGGRGKLANEDFQLRTGKWVRGGGYVPCPACRGSKLVAIVVVKQGVLDVGGSDKTSGKRR